MKLAGVVFIVAVACALGIKPSASTAHRGASQALLHVQANASPREIQKQVQNMVLRLKKLNDPETASEFEEEIGDVEAALLKRGGSDQKLVTEISIVRADLCAQQGFQHEEFSDCQDFMRSACHMETDGSQEVSGTTSEVYFVPLEDCQSFFRQEVLSVAAPAPSPAGPPGALFGGKEERALPSQGFDEYSEGQLVEHDNKKTFTSDWRREFGPDANHRSYQAICAKHPGNEWCRLHGYEPGTHGAGKSSSLCSSGSSWALAIAVMSWLWGRTA